MLEQWGEYLPPLSSNTCFSGSEHSRATNFADMLMSHRQPQISRNSLHAAVGHASVGIAILLKCFGREDRSAQERYSEVGRYPRRRRFFWNAKRRVRIRNCPRCTTALTCRAGCKEHDVSKNRNAARSSATLGSLATANQARPRLRDARTLARRKRRQSVQHSTHNQELWAAL